MVFTSIRSLFWTWNHNVLMSWVSLLVVVIGSVISEDVYLNKIAVHVKGGHSIADRIAREAGLRNLGQIGSLDDHYLFEIPHRHTRSADPSQEHHAALSTHPQVHWFEQQVVKSRRKRDFVDGAYNQNYLLNDPYYKNQWYLHGGGYGNFDMNVIDAWRKGYSGKNIVVSILDDGIERDHPDLIVNYDPYASYDVNGQDNDPMPRYDSTDENRHGTRCAGEVSATANNSQCAVGIAFNSRIGGVRMLDGDVFDAVEAASLSFNRSHIDIYSASWGPDDDGRVVDGPGPLAKKAFENGIKQGRNGKGSIFVWASGNGGNSQDSCNCDGYANSIYTLSISSTSERGTKPWYLEECSSTLATTYSSGAYNEKQIVTVDLHKRCTQSHTGTSASAPLAAGIVALMLEANPELTWRDVQYITLMTARPEPMVDGQWVTNALGRKVSLRYGYGLMDASRMLDLALVWQNVPQKHECLAVTREENLGLSGPSYTSTIETNGCDGDSTEVRFLEHVQCRVTLSFHPRGNLVLYLTSPQGTRSTILPRRPNDMSPAGFNDWPFLSVHFWGEDPRGKWTLEIENGDPMNRDLEGGRLVSWALVFHGTVEQPVRLRNITSPLKVFLAVPKNAEQEIAAMLKPTETPSPTTNSPTPTLHPLRCHAECEPTKGCTGMEAADCLQCRNFRNQSNRACVAQCGSRMYTHEGVCSECHESCETCSGPTLVQCLSCDPDVKFHPKHNTCAENCMIGTYYDVEHCMPCDKSCKECLGPRPEDCTMCKNNREVSEDGLCHESTWISKIQNSMHGIVLGVVLLCSLLLLVIGVAMVVLAHQRHKLCFAYNSYDRLCQDGDEDDCHVAMTYDNDIDFRDTPTTKS